MIERGWPLRSRRTRVRALAHAEDNNKDAARLVISHRPKLQLPDEFAAFVVVADEAALACTGERNYGGCDRGAGVGRARTRDE